MISIQPVLYSRPKKDGRYPLVIRITKNRKSSLMFTGQAIYKDEWDNSLKRVKKNHPNSTRLNAFLAKKVAEANAVHLNNQVIEKEDSARLIYESMRSDKSKKSFFDVANQYLDNLEKEGKYNQLVSDRARVKRFKKFLKNQDVNFEDISPAVLQDYKAWLKGTHKNTERTAVNSLIVIRTVFNRAIKSNFVDRKYYPFGQGKVVIRFPESKKIGLTKEEISQLETADLTEHPRLDNVRNIWLIAFYFAGVRISDVLQLRWSDIVDGRLLYQMGKNAKVSSLKIPDKALDLIHKYDSFKKSSSDYIFQELNSVRDQEDKYDVQKNIKNAVKRINKYLDLLAKHTQIDKKLTSHIARHSFGRISGDRIPIQMLQKLYRHSHVTTTINYQKSFIYKDTDEALERVLDFESK